MHCRENAQVAVLGERLRVASLCSHDRPVDSSHQRSTVGPAKNTASNSGQVYTMSALLCNLRSHSQDNFQEQICNGPIVFRCMVKNPTSQ